MSTSLRTGRVVVLGSLNVDIVARVDHHPAPGETLMGRGGESLPGGKGANQALAAALCGADVTMIGAVGNDAGATVATALLQNSGCSLDNLITVPGPTGTALITVDGHGENTIIVIPGANALLSPEHLSPLHTLKTGDLLVLQGEIPPATCAAAAHLAHDRGARILINLAPVVPYDAEVLRMANPLVVNEHEGQGALDILGGPPTTTPEETVTGLLNAGVRSVVMTLGSHGAIVAAPELTHIPAKKVTPVDTTGAGDAFTGALAAGIARDQPLTEAANLATNFAAKTVTQHGAQNSYPDWRHR